MARAGLCLDTSAFPSHEASSFDSASPIFKKKPYKESLMRLVYINDAESVGLFRIIYIGT